MHAWPGTCVGDRLSPYHPLAPSAAGEENGSNNHTTTCVTLPLMHLQGAPGGLFTQRQHPGHLGDFVLGDGLVGDD